MKKVFKMAMMLFVLVSFLTLPLPGLAEEYTTGEEVKKEEKKKKEEAKKEEKKAVELEEIVVTATATETPILDAPTNITVISKEDIHNMKARDISDVLAHVPGIRFDKYSGAAPVPNIRGTQVAYTGGAHIMLNNIPIQLGVYGTTEIEQIAPGDIERIEVVKGPVSSLYGGDAAKGVINIITKKGKGEPAYAIGGRYGSYGDMHTLATARGATKKLDYALSLNRREYDGYRRGAENNGTNFLGNTNYFINDNTSIGLLLDVNDFERKNAASLNKEQRAADKRQSPFLSTKDITDVIAGLSLDHDTKSYAAKGSIYYKHRDEDFFYPYPNKYGGNPDQYKWTRDTTQDIGGLRTQFSYKEPFLGRKNTFLAGFDMEKDDLDTRLHYLVASASHTASENKGSGDFGKQLYGVFVEDQFELFDPLIITMALRYDWFRTKMDYLDNSLNYGKNDSKLNPRLGIVCRFTNMSSAYLTYSNAYQPASLCQLYHVGQFDRTLDPSHYTNYETGYRHDLGKYLFADITVFYTIVKDEVRCYYEEGVWAGPNNYGKTIHKGLEVSFTGELFDRLRYNLSYAYLKTEVKEGMLKDVDLTGKELDSCPEHTIGAILDYLLVSTGNLDIDLHFDIKFNSSAYLDALNTEKYPSYEVANARVSFSYKKIKFWAGINNLFNKDYDDSAGLWGGQYYYSPAADRTYLAGLSFRF